MVQKYIQPYCLAKYVKLYIGVCCDFEYGTSVPSCGLLFYEQFSTVLKPIMTLVAEMLDFKQQHFQILARRYTSSGQKIHIFWPEDIYLLVRRYISHLSLPIPISSGQNIYIYTHPHPLLIAQPEDLLFIFEFLY